MTTYHVAAECFEHNTKRLDPDQDRALWNLSNGLHALAVRLSQDVPEMMRELDRIQQKLQHVEYAVGRLK